MIGAIARLLVQPLTSTDAESEPAVRQQGGRRGGLGHDCRVYRMNGHVTPVANSIVDVRAAAAASIAKAKPECSCSFTHG